MADNLTTQTTVATPPSGSVIGTRQVTYSGDANVHVAPVGLVAFSGADDAKVATDLPGDAANGLDVDVTRVSGNVTVIQGTAANLKVDPSSVTSPISAASLPLPTGASTAAKQPALGTAGSASTDVLTIQGIASMTKLLVTPDSVALPANQSVNVNQLAGTATDTNSGTKSAGTLRVVLATDQPALTNKLLVTPDSVALPANQSVNVSQINGVTPLMGAGNTGTGSPRVTIATDQVAIPVSQSGTWTVQPGNTANTTPWLTTTGKTLKSKTGSASATFTIVSAVASKRIKVTGLSLLTASTTAVTVTFKDAAAGTAIGTYILQAITGTNFGISDRGCSAPDFIFATSAGNLLEMSFSAAVSVTYNLSYFDDDAT